MQISKTRTRNSLKQIAQTNIGLRQGRADGTARVELAGELLRADRFVFAGKVSALSDSHVGKYLGGKREVP